MRKFLFIISASMLIISCGQSPNKEESQFKSQTSSQSEVKSTDTKPKQESTIIGKWKSAQDGQVVEITPTHWKGVWGEESYAIKDDRFITYSADGTPSIEYKFSFDGTNLVLESTENPHGDMALTRYDPEEERKRAENFEKGWNSLVEEKKAERESNKGNEQDGEIISYCPMCYKDADKAYAVQNGMLVEEPNFVKGASLVCYSCAKKLQANYFK